MYCIFLLRLDYEFDTDVSFPIPKLAPCRKVGRLFFQGTGGAVASLTRPFPDREEANGADRQTVNCSAMMRSDRP